MTPRDVQVTARTIRTEAGTTHTVYRVGEREFYDVDTLEAHLADVDEPPDAIANSPRLEATP